MTTVLLTDQYLTADRLISYDGFTYEAPKIKKLKNRLAYFIGSKYPDEAERKVYDREIYKLMFGNAKSKQHATAVLTEMIEFNEILIMTAKKNFRVKRTLPKFEVSTRNWNEDTPITIFEYPLQQPLYAGTGDDFAVAGWMCGLQPEEIMQAVIELDPCSGFGYDIIRREELWP